MGDDSYTHRPGDVSSDRGGRDDDHGDEEFPDAPADDPAAPVERGNEEWNYRDWILVSVIVVCFLVIPAAILVLPPVRPFKFAYLVLPLIPAFLLGAVAVWSAQRSG